YLESYCTFFLRIQLSTFRIFHLYFFFFFFNVSVPTNIYTLSLHDALPIYFDESQRVDFPHAGGVRIVAVQRRRPSSTKHVPNAKDRKSTRLNSSHEWISYAVFCLKKKNNANKLIINMHVSSLVEHI